MKPTMWNAEWLETDLGVVLGKYEPSKKVFPHKAPTLALAQKRVAVMAQSIISLQSAFCLRRR